MFGQREPKFPVHNVVGQVRTKAHIRDSVQQLQRGVEVVGDTIAMGFKLHRHAKGDGALSGVGSDYDSTITNVAGQFAYGDMKLLASYQQVDGDAYKISWDGYNNDDNSYQLWNDVQRFSFDNADEQSWQARIDYNLSGLIDGLSTMARYTSGDNITRSDGMEGSEWERDIDVSYTVQSGTFKNLALRWRNAMVRSDATRDIDENRLILSYSIALK